MVNQQQQPTTTNISFGKFDLGEFFTRVPWYLVTYASSQQQPPPPTTTNQLTRITTITTTTKSTNGTHQQPTSASNIPTKTNYNQQICSLTLTDHVRTLSGLHCLNSCFSFQSSWDISVFPFSPFGTSLWLYSNRNFANYLNNTNPHYWKLAMT